MFSLFKKGKEAGIPRLSPDASSVNVANSILRYFGVPQFHETYAPLDKILDVNPDRKICVLLFDGFGKYIQKVKKKSCPFIWAHRRFDIETVYPPTTVAATTSLLSGLYPIETAWLGWVQYFRQAGVYVTMFSGAIEGTRTPSAINPREILRHQTITDLIDARAGDKITDQVMGFDSFGPKGELSPAVFFDHVEKAVQKPANKFTYGYWSDPDHSMHLTGLHSRETDKAIQTIDKSFALLCERNPDVLFLTIADHGHIQLKWWDIRDYPDLVASLYEPRFSIEPRFATFLVKPDCHKAFEDAYQAHFSRDFAMYTKQRLYDENVFGYGQSHPLNSEFIGDYTLIATKDKALCDGYNFTGMVSGHAGATAKERIVSLGIANDKN